MFNSFTVDAGVSSTSMSYTMKGRKVSTIFVRQQELIVFTDYCQQNQYPDSIRKEFCCRTVILGVAEIQSDKINMVLKSFIF